MADETENLTLHLLREMQAEQQAFMAEQRTANAKLEAKLDKLNVELVGVKGRVRKSGELLESIARLRSGGALG